MIHTNELLAKGVIPDALIRMGIRHRLAGTLAPFEIVDCEQRQAMVMRHVDELRSSPVAIATDEANEQHYELPTRFFERVLGKHMKYSSGYWDDGVTGIDESEARMLGITCERAGLEDSRTRLRLGIAHAVDGGALSERADHGGFQLADAENPHRLPARGARPDQRRGADREHDPLRR